MKKIIPIGYFKSSIGKLVSVFVILFSVLLILPMIQSCDTVVNLKYFVIFAAVLAILLFMSDVIRNRKNAEKIKRMEYLLTCPSVKGEVIELKRIPYFFGKEITNMPKTNVKVYIPAKHAVYRICARFHNPLTDADEIAVSEIYTVCVKDEIKDNSVDVHYSPDGDIWVEV